MAHGVVCHFDLPHMAQKVADWTRREGRPRADEMAHGAVCRFELPHVAENNRRVTRVDSSLWPQRTVPKLPSGTNGCQTLKTATLNTSYFCQKRPLCQPPPSPTPPPNSHFVRKVKLRLAYRLAFVTLTKVVAFKPLGVCLLLVFCSFPQPFEVLFLNGVKRWFAASTSFSHGQQVLLALRGVMWLSKCCCLSLVAHHSEMPKLFQEERRVDEFQCASFQQNVPETFPQLITQQEKKLIEDSLTAQSWGYWATRSGTWSSTFFWEDLAINYALLLGVARGPAVLMEVRNHVGFHVYRVSISPPLQWNNIKPLNSDLHPWDHHVAANLLVQWNLASQPANRKVGSPFHSCEWNPEIHAIPLVANQAWPSFTSDSWQKISQ